MSWLSWERCAQALPTLPALRLCHSQRLAHPGSSSEHTGLWGPSAAFLGNVKIGLCSLHFISRLVFISI